GTTRLSGRRTSQSHCRSTRNRSSRCDRTTSTAVAPTAAAHRPAISSTSWTVPTSRSHRTNKPPDQESHAARRVMAAPYPAPPDGTRIRSPYEPCSGLSLRRRCGSTTYLGSLADWNPALNTDQRSAASPASTRPLPAIAANRLRLADGTRSAPPAIVHALAIQLYLPASPRWY